MRYGIDNDWHTNNDRALDSHGMLVALEQAQVPLGGGRAGMDVMVQPRSHLLS